MDGSAFQFIENVIARRMVADSQRREDAIKTELAKQLALALAPVVDQWFIANARGTMDEATELAGDLADEAVDVFADFVRHAKSTTVDDFIGAGA